VTHEPVDKGEDTMTIWKDGKTAQQVADDVLRNYLIRCHRTVSHDYPEISNMAPTNAADYLMHLRNTGRIRIKLFNKTPNLIGCRIEEVDQASK